MASSRGGKGRTPTPKGRPTVGQRQQRAAARARARRRRFLRRLYWAAGVALFLGLLVVLAVTGLGAGDAPGPP